MDDDFGFLIVSSTDRIKVAASMAPVMELRLTIAGSQTNAEKLSAMSSHVMSTPNHILPREGGERELRMNSLFSNLVHVLVLIC